MFYLYQGLYDFIQSRPGIREFHSTILRFIVGIHSTFFRERQLAFLADMPCVSFAAELLVGFVLAANPAVMPLLFLLFRHFIMPLLFRLQISAYYLNE